MPEVTTEFIGADGKSITAVFTVSRRVRPAPECDGNRVSAMRVYTVASVTHPSVVGRGTNLSKAEDLAFDAYAREVLGWG